MALLQLIDAASFPGKAAEFVVEIKSAIQNAEVKSVVRTPGEV